MKVIPYVCETTEVYVTLNKTNEIVGVLYDRIYTYLINIHDCPGLDASGSCRKQNIISFAVQYSRVYPSKFDILHANTMKRFIRKHFLEETTPA